MKENIMYKHILKELFSLIDKKHIVTTIYYGNRNGKDIDLLVILDKDIYYEQKKTGNLDIIMIGDRYFDYFVSNFNLIVTEPILLGEVIYGERVDDKKEYLFLSRSDRNTVVHLLDFAQQIFKQTKKDIKALNYENAMTNIVFCLSYINFAEYYKERRGVITFQELMVYRSNSMLAKAYSDLKRNKISKENLVYFFNETRKILKKSLQDALL